MSARGLLASVIRTQFAEAMDHDHPGRYALGPAVCALILEIAEQLDTPKVGRWINADDVLTLTKRLDVALNGEREGMATHPALCDVVAQACEAARTRGPLLPQFFTASEIKALAESPQALRALADYHDVQSTMADAVNDEGVYNGCIEHHDARAKELNALADKIEKEHEG